MHIPLPSFSWANGAEVWESMREKDITYAKLRSERLLERHPSLVDSYRTILFDWLSEVSHECKFHRETYHLALDFIDRYLAATSNIGKYQLQLIGTTCLFLAAKYEEIRPPTVTEFAELTDGACKPEEIVDNEVVVLSAINWDITPMTPNSWLNIYMQILSNLDQEDDVTTTNNNDDLTISRDAHSHVHHHHHHQHLQQRSEVASAPQYDDYCNEENSRSSTISTRSTSSTTRSSRRSVKKQKTYSDRLTSTMAPATTTTATSCLDENSMSCEFRLAPARNDSFILPSSNGFLRYNHKRIASVVDLALLHIESLRFTNSILTAAAIYHFTTQETIHQCTGYNYEQLAECIHWLEPFVETIREVQEPVFIASCKGVIHPTQMHSHIATATMLDEVKVKIEVYRHNQMQSAALKRKAVEMENEETSNDAQVSSASGSVLVEQLDGRVLVLGGNSDHLTVSPLKPSTTVLLTPPSSTCKARGRLQKRNQQQMREQQRRQRQQQLQQQHSARGGSSGGGPFRFAPQVRSMQ